MKKLLMLLLLLLPLAITSCGDDKDEPESTANDPDGTVTLNIMLDEKCYLDNITYIFLDYDYNFYADKIYQFGKVNNLGKINSITQEEMATYLLKAKDKASAEVGYGYLVSNGWGGGSYSVYVISELTNNSESIIGYKIKYAPIHLK